MKKIFTISIMASILNATPNTSVIFMIGDGMGPAYTSTLRYYSDNKTSDKIKLTVFDNMLVGMNSTYSKNSIITDSAAAGTALATGYKTDNGYIDKSAIKHQTVLEYAKMNGYITAMAVTSTITHATPAAFMVHGHHRDSQTNIAKDFFIKNGAGKLKFDFLMGAGETHFNKAFSDFNATAKENGIKIYRDGYNFDEINSYPFIAFTNYNYVPYAIDENDNNKFRVAKMTKKSLDLLDGKAFFLMIEASQIDWCGHINDIGCAMAEMIDFEKSIDIAKRYVDKNPNTLLVVTADHSTGGLNIGKKIKKDNPNLTEDEKSKSYIWNSDIIKNIKASSIVIAKKIKESRDINKTFKEYTNITLTSSEYKKLKSSSEKKDKNIRIVVNDIINTRSNTGWTTHGHIPIDVETFAYGKGSNKFKGFLDNTDIAKKIFEVLSK